MRDSGVARSVGTGTTLPPMVEVACGVPMVTQLITSYFETVLVPCSAYPLPLVLIDLPHGFAFQRFESLCRSDLSIIVVTSSRCPEYLEDLWDLQPAVLLAVEYHLNDLLYVVERAARGERVRFMPGEPTQLTPNERLLLHKVARGWSNWRIAVSQDLQPKTVSNQITLLCEKLHLPDRTAAVLYYWGQFDRID